MRRKGFFNVKIDYEDENVVNRKNTKIDEVEELVHKLKLKFR